VEINNGNHLYLCVYFIIIQIKVIIHFYYVLFCLIIYLIYKITKIYGFIKLMRFLFRACNRGTHMEKQYNGVLEL